MVTTASAVRTASATDAAGIAPAATASVALAMLRLKTVTA